MDDEMEDKIEKRINALIDKFEEKREMKLSSTDKNLIRIGYWAAVRDIEIEQMPLQQQILN